MGQNNSHGRTNPLSHVNQRPSLYSDGQKIQNKLNFPLNNNHFTSHVYFVFSSNNNHFTSHVYFVFSSNNNHFTSSVPDSSQHGSHHNIISRYTQ